MSGLKFRIGGQTTSVYAMPAGRLVRGAAVLSLLLGFGSGFRASCPAAPVILTNAADVLMLSAEQAGAGRPVLLRGVVTAAEKYWSGRFFLQDISGGVFVDNLNALQPSPGDYVEVSGTTHPGAFAPCVTHPQWRPLGTAPLPKAKPVSIERVMSGSEDGQRIEISGTVRAVQVENALLSLDLMSGGFRLRIFAPIPPGLDDLQTLVGDKVRVRGTAAVSFNAQLRQMTMMKIFAPLLEDFIVEESESSDPFSEPVVSLRSIGQYQMDRIPGRRVHVRGVVTIQRPGEDLFLKDDTSGLQIKSRQRDALAAGDTIEAVGFPDFEHFRPVLQDAIFRKTGAAPVAVTPKAVATRELQDGLHHADFVTLQGRLLDRVMTWREERSGAGMQLRTTLMLQGSNQLFSAECETSPEAAQTLARVPVGSIVAVSGVCVSEIAPDGKLTSLQILLPTEQSLRVLQRPGWWTPQRLLGGLAILFAVLVVAIAWTVVISRKNAALQTTVHEKEQAQIELQHANNRLEERVKEGLEQLKLQITARQESELQFRAVLNERMRLAQELHDTLEQTLTGIALQMDTAAKFAGSEKERADHHLELARNLVTQSQTEVRCSVWDLRSRSREQMDLSNLLLKISRQLTDDTGIRVEVAAKGRVRPLPEVIEENLLRIAQEALTNIIKHSRATQANLVLDYGPRHVRIQIQDNGSGFVVDHHAGPSEGHFGLLGITERTKRLHGQLAIRSTPGGGTTIEVTIPIEAPAGAAPASST